MTIRHVVLFSGVLGQFKMKKSLRTAPLEGVRASQHMGHSAERISPLRPAGFLAVMNLHGIFLCLAYIFGIQRSLPLTIWSKQGKD